MQQLNAFATLKLKKSLKSMQVKTFRGGGPKMKSLARAKHCRSLPLKWNSFISNCFVSLKRLTKGKYFRLFARDASDESKSSFISATSGCICQCQVVQPPRVQSAADGQHLLLQVLQHCLSEPGKKG